MNNNINGALQGAIQSNVAAVAAKTTDVNQQATMGLGIVGETTGGAGGHTTK